MSWVSDNLRARYADATEQKFPLVAAFSGKHVSAHGGRARDVCNENRESLGIRKVTDRLTTPQPSEDMPQRRYGPSARFAAAALSMTSACKASLGKEKACCRSVASCCARSWSDRPATVSICVRRVAYSS